jgi:hypothetical protein
MIPDELIQRISQQDVVALPDWRVAEILNSPDTTLPIITEWKKTELGFGSVLSALGINEGSDVLDNLFSIPQMKWAFKVLEQGNLDISLSVTRQQIQQLSDPPLNLLTSEQVDSILNLSKSERFPSWSEYHNIYVDARIIGIARGGF